jgi:ABC-type phosphate/phosphonate transport system substrate-binding protein
MSIAASPPLRLVANARMYAIDARVEALWMRLFEWLAADAAVDLRVIDHGPPRSLAQLWRRDDLGCAFMCGYPWASWDDAGAGRPRLLAAPLPSPARYSGRSGYCTDIVVRSDSRYADVDALRGARFGYTVEHSQSGWQAPRALFAARASGAGGRWFRDVVGPLHTPRAVVGAIVDDRVDAGPLDSWWHDLLKRHEPATASRLRTIASTPMTPIPPLVAAAGVPDDVVGRLTCALDRVGTLDALQDVCDGLLISGFMRAAPADYAALAQHARCIDALGYPRLQ